MAFILKPKILLPCIHFVLTRPYLAKWLTRFQSVRRNKNHLFFSANFIKVKIFLKFKRTPQIHMWQEWYKYYNYVTFILFTYDMMGLPSLLRHRKLNLKIWIISINITLTRFVLRVLYLFVFEILWSQEIRHYNYF